MRTLPTALAAAALCASLSLPAEATPQGVFTGTMHVDCFGCGASPASADMIFIPTGPAHGAFTVDAGGGIACLATWSFVGRIADATGWVDVNGTVVSGKMVITGVDDDSDIRIGGGYVVGPGGVTCGAATDFTIIGWIA